MCELNFRNILVEDSRWAARIAVAGSPAEGGNRPAEGEGSLRICIQEYISFKSNVLGAR